MGKKTKDFNHGNKDGVVLSGRGGHD